MSNYTQVTFFAPKDVLITGNPSKLIKGAEVDPEFAAISASLATKLDTTGGTVFAADGSVGNPSVTFANDTDTGLYRTAVNDLKFTTGGIFALGLDSNQRLRANDGTTALPAYSFLSDNTSGLRLISAGNVGFAAGATSVGAFSNAGFNLGFQDGLVGSPAITFQSDPDTGLYHAAVNAPAMSAGGVRAQSWSTQGMGIEVDGAAATPGLYWGNNSNTGFYRDTNNQIGIALAGVTAGQIAQGNFTGTLTGYAAGPTGTVNYQRIGKIVTLWITAAIVGTSNASTLGMNGLPAIIQPASVVAVPSVFMRDDATTGGSPVIGHATITGGTITFGRGLTSGGTLIADVAGWSSSGTKGLQNGWTLSYPVS